MMVYVTSDLHGYPLEKFRQLLDRAGFSKEDVLFVLGDVIDRGPQSVELLEWLRQQDNIKLIKGNHEAMLTACLFLFDTITEQTIEDVTQEDIEAYQIWLANGGYVTLQELSMCSKDTVRDIIEYITEAPLWDTVCVNGKTYVLVHGGLGGFEPSKALEDYSADELLWTRPEIDEAYYDDAITIFGHTPTHFYGEEYRGKAVKKPTWVDIDTGAACGGAPMLLRLEDMKEYYIADEFDV